MARIIATNFGGTDEQRTNAMMNNAFEQGRRTAFQQLLQYDRDQQEKGTES